MTTKHGRAIPTEYLNIYGPYTRADGRMLQLGLCAPIDVAQEIPIEDRTYRQVQVPE